MRENYIVTSIGRKFFYSDLPSSYPAEEISLALSKICRFSGNSSYHYSVAEHSILCARLARLRGYEPRVQLAALLHDAPEAYMGDLPGPLKRYLEQLGSPSGWSLAYSDLDRSIFDKVMRDRGALVDRYAMDAVKTLDRTILSVELSSVFETTIVDEDLPTLMDEEEVRSIKIFGFCHDTAHRAFMFQHSRIMRQITN